MLDHDKLILFLSNMKEEFHWTTTKGFFFGLGGNTRFSNETIEIYNNQVEEYAKLLDYKNRSILSDINFNFLYDKKVLKDTKTLCSDFYNQLTLRVKMDVLVISNNPDINIPNNKVPELSVKLFAFWLHVAFKAYEYNNLHVFEAIKLGITSLDIDRLFDEDRGCYSILLPEHIKNLAKMINNINLKSTLLNQSEMLPPYRLFFGCLENALDGNNHVLLADGVLKVLTSMYMFNLQSNLISPPYIYTDNEKQFFDLFEVNPFDNPAEQDNFFDSIYNSKHKDNYQNGKPALSPRLSTKSDSFTLPTINNFSDDETFRTIKDLNILQYEAQKIRSMIENKQYDNLHGYLKFIIFECDAFHKLMIKNPRDCQLFENQSSLNQYGISLTSILNKKNKIEKQDEYIHKIIKNKIIPKKNEENVLNHTNIDKKENTVPHEVRSPRKHHHKKEKTSKLSEAPHDNHKTKKYELNKAKSDKTLDHGNIPFQETSRINTVSKRKGIPDNKKLSNVDKLILKFELVSYQTKSDNFTSFSRENMPSSSSSYLDNRSSSARNNMPSSSSIIMDRSTNKTPFYNQGNKKTILKSTALNPK